MQLKLYRARTSQRMSNASSSTATTDLSSPRKDARRQSLILANASISSKADITGSHHHRRSLSKTGFLAGEGVKGHGKRMSRSRASRGSISGFAGVSKAGGHGHTRSRASISISMSSPAAQQQTLEESLDRTPTPSGSARLAGLGAPPSWQQQNAFPMSPEPSRPLSAQLSNLPLRSTSPLPPAPATGPPPASHGRHGSRHTRRSSVANFRESLEIVSGANQPLPTNLHAAVSSFSAPSAHGTTSPSSAASHSPLPGSQPSLPAWSSDPRQVLEALKERGRFEDEGSLSPEQTRQSALEALEGRVSAPSPVISLGNEEPGELLTAPPPAAGTALSPLPPSGFSTSPMIGLGVGVSNKRNSWGPVGGASNVTVVGGQGAMELGGIVEEDEEEEEERRTSTPVSSPRRINTSSPRKRDSARSKDGSNPSPKRSSIRPLSLSLSSPITSNHSPSNSRSYLAARAPSGPPSPIDERAAHSPGEKRHISVFHSVAASQLGHGLPTSPNLSTGGSTPRGGLRSLSIGNSNSNATSSASLLDRRFPSRSASVGTAATLAQTTPRRPSPLPAVNSNSKRSSISYRTDGATPPVSRYSFNSSPALVSPTVSTSHYSSFPFGVTGGFGDLEVDDELSSNTSRPTSFIDTRQSAAAEAELASLRTQLEQLELRQSHLVSTHALEITEFERKASEEAGEMRSRISELERQLDDERNARRIELEGLQREVSMAKEAVVDLTDERDSLREDVDGWRSRCNKLETTLKKEREEEALADAQGKLIGEMRDQIYTLVAALERERGEHGETRKEVERMLEERVREAAAEVKQHPHQQQPQRSDSVALDMGMGMDDDEEDDDEESSLGMGSHYHQSKTTSDASMLSGSSFSHSFSGNTTEDTSIGTDLEDSFSNHKNSSPHSGHSSFNSIPSVFSNSAPNSVRGRDSDVAAALGQLDTLAEEDEEDEEAALGGNSLSHEDRIRLDSAGSQLSSSTTSDVMPRTPDKTSSDHNRSHSFIRHWSVSPHFSTFLTFRICTDSYPDYLQFPKGSICSSRVSYEEEDSSFFGYNKHDSLPPLPISDNILPPFLSASLDVDEETFAFFPPQAGHRSNGSASSHARRPSSPRPLDRMNPHARRFSGQYAMKAPPVSPSALVTAALQKQQQQPPARTPSASISSSTSASKSVSRLSFGALIGSLGGWSPAGSNSVDSLPAPATAKLGLGNAPVAVLEEDEDEDEEEDSDNLEEDVFITTTSNGTPRQLQHQNQRPLRYIKPNEVPRPVAARLGLLNFVGSVCCSDRPVFVV